MSRRVKNQGRKKTVIVHLTARSAATLWQMLCSPGIHWEQKDWYRGEDPSAENELARLHQFVDNKVATTKDDGQSKEFTNSAYSLRKDLVARAEKVVNHYRDKCKKGTGGVLAIQFAELSEGLKGNKPDFDADYDDDDDAEELKKLQEEYAAERDAEPEAVASGE